MFGLPGGPCATGSCHISQVYAVEWTSEKIEFFVDDRKYYTYGNEGKGHEQWPFDEPFHLILNVAVGGSWGGRRGIDDSAFPAAMEVAFVKVFQRRPDDVAPAEPEGYVPMAKL